MHALLCLRSHSRVIHSASRTLALVELLTISGETYPELVNGGIARYPGADYPEAPLEPVLREQLKTKYQFIFGLGNNEIGYLISKAEWDEEPPWLMNAANP